MSKKKKFVKKKALRTFTVVVGMSLFVFRRKNIAEAVAFVEAHFKGTPNIKLEEVHSLTIMQANGKGQVHDFTQLGHKDFETE